MTDSDAMEARMSDAYILIFEKKLSNMRSSGSDNTVTVRPPRELSLDQSIEFISEDELVEITPMSVRLRKMDLDQQKREATSKTC